MISIFVIIIIIFIIIISIIIIIIVIIIIIIIIIVRLLKPCISFQEEGHQKPTYLHNILYCKNRRCNLKPL